MSGILLMTMMFMLQIDIDGEHEQVQEQSESIMDTTNTPLRGDPTPQKRRSESEHSGGLQRKSSRTI